MLLWCNTQTLYTLAFCTWGFIPKLNQGVALPWLCTRDANQPLTKATRLLLFSPLSHNHARVCLNQNSNGCVIWYHILPTTVHFRWFFLIKKKRKKEEKALHTTMQVGIYKLQNTKCMHARGQFLGKISLAHAFNKFPFQIWFKGCFSGTSESSLFLFISLWGMLLPSHRPHTFQIYILTRISVFLRVLLPVRLLFLQRFPLLHRF